MAISKHIAVLDLGTSNIRILAAKAQDSNSVKIIGKAEQPGTGIAGSSIVDPEAVAEAVKTALTKIKTQTGLIIQSLYVSIPSEKISFVKNEAEDVLEEEKEISNKDIGMLLDKVTDVDIYDNETLIGVAPIQFSVDDGEPVKNPLGMTGSKLKVYANIVLANSEYIKSVKMCLSEAGVSVDGFVPLCLAMKWTLENSCKAESVLQIDVGGSMSEYALYYRGIPFTVGTLSIGGNMITSQIADAFGISEADAESLKKEYNAANCDVITKDQEIVLNNPTAEGRDTLRVSEIVAVIESGINGIIESVGRRVVDDKVDFRYIESVILSGDGLSKFEGIEKNCEDLLGLKCEEVDFGRTVGMKNSFAYAGGMVLYIAEQLPLGRHSSKIVREEAPAPTEQPKEGLFAKMKGKLKNFLPGYRE